MMRAIRNAVAGFVPTSLLLRMRLNRELKRGEPEIRLLPMLLASGGTFVDIGGNLGVYAAYACRYTKSVHIFEPHPVLSEQLRRAFATRARVHAVALSDRTGTVDFHVPVLASRDVHSRGSIETCHAGDFTHMRSVKVDCCRLDDFDFREIAAIKIDVEGHELAVLRGASKTLAQHRPAIIVEVEEFRMPGSFDQVCAMMRELDYEGFYVHRGELKGLDGYDLHFHQHADHRLSYGDSARDPDLVNNFVFVPPEKAFPFVAGTKL